MKYFLCTLLGQLHPRCAGDSFIIAFQNPATALVFCMEVQQQMLNLPWPTELLQYYGTEEVWLTPAYTGSQRPHGSPRSAFGGLARFTPPHISMLTLPQASQPQQPQQQLGASVTAAPTPAEGGKGESAPVWDYRKTWQATWLRCGAHKADSILAFRGLRVRLGIHAGVTDESCITFNAVMQRYHYTGEPCSSHACHAQTSWHAQHGTHAHVHVVMH
jgi:hypothetical protein